MSYATDTVFQSVEKICHSDQIEPVLIQAWHHWLGEKPQSIHVQTNLTYYRPYDRARIVADVTVVPETGDASIALQLFFNVFADATEVRQQLENGYALAVPPNAALPVFAIEDWQTVVWTLPHAPCLPELSELLRPEYFCPLLISLSDLPAQVEAYPAPQLFRYVPFKRAILTWQSPTTANRYFVKLCTEAEFPKVVHNFQQIYHYSERLSFAVPQPVVADATSRTFSMRALAGQQFTQIMRQLQPQPCMKIGQILAELHHADLYPTAVWTAAKELKTCNQAMAEVKLALPHLSQSIDRTITQLTQRSQQLKFPTGYPIHANLFGDQILYGAEKIGMVDWDTLSFGDPHYDIGRLIAHFIYLAGCDQLAAKEVKTCIAALITGYESEITWTLDPACLNWHIAMQLLLRGKISSLRKLPENWQTHLEFVAAEAEWLLAGCSEYLPTLMPVFLTV